MVKMKMSISQHSEAKNKRIMAATAYYSKLAYLIKCTQWKTVLICARPQVSLRRDMTHISQSLELLPLTQ